MQRCSGPEDWEVGRGRIKLGGDRGASGSREASSGAGRGPEGGAGSTRPPPTSGRAPSRSLPLVPGRPPQSRRRSRAWGPGGAVAQRRRRQERPRRRWRLRGGSPPAAPRSSRRSLAPPARLGGAPAGSAWLRRPGSPMRSGGRRASATAVTAAPVGVGGFAAAPGAGPVPSGGGCRLRDYPPGHAEAAAAAARGECGAARSRARWPSAAQEGPGGKSSGRADGASCRGGRLPTPRLVGGRAAQPFLLASPEKLEARGGRLGPATPGSPRSGLGSGAAGCVEPGAGRVAGNLWIGRGPGKAQPLTQGPARTSRREAEDACLRTAWASPRPVLSPAESRGEGREGTVREPAPKVRGRESPWNSWSVIPPPDWAENNRLRLI